MMPKSIKTDNGSPFGVPSRDVISIMSLWLKAWGIVPILNRPRRPTDNAVVERAQGTTSRWAEVEKCQNLVILQQRLDEACIWQREKYPVTRLGSITRAKLYESLGSKTRSYEHAIFDEKKAYEYLSELVMPRKVSESGMIMVYNKVLSVGAQHKRKLVRVKSSPTKPEWNILDEKGNICKIIHDPRFSRERLFNLTCQRT